jgi:hypothetical protein
MPARAQWPPYLFQGRRSKVPATRGKSPQRRVPCEGKLVWVKIVITEIGVDGGIRRAPDTWGLTDGGRWETLIG